MELSLLNTKMFVFRALCGAVSISALTITLNSVHSATTSCRDGQIKSWPDSADTKKKGSGRAEGRAGKMSSDLGPRKTK